MSVVYKVIVYVIYSLVDYFLCLYYLGIVQQNLSALACDKKI